MFFGGRPAIAHAIFLDPVDIGFHARERAGDGGKNGVVVIEAAGVTLGELALEGEAALAPLRAVGVDVAHGGDHLGKGNLVAFDPLGILPAAIGDEIDLAAEAPDRAEDTDGGDGGGNDVPDIEVPEGPRPFEGAGVSKGK
jgi:hypothetical protein